MEAVRKAGDMYRNKLKERIERKLEHADEKREARLSNLQDRIRTHVRQRQLTPCGFVFLSVLSFLYLRPMLSVHSW